MHQLTEMRFSNWQNSFKTVATTSFHAEKCCHLVGAQLHMQRPTTCNPLAILSTQFLMHSTFIQLVN